MKHITNADRRRRLAAQERVLRELGIHRNSAPAAAINCALAAPRDPAFACAMAMLGPAQASFLMRMKAAAYAVMTARGAR